MGWRCSDVRYSANRVDTFRRSGTAKRHRCGRGRPGAPRLREGGDEAAGSDLGNLGADRGGMRGVWAARRYSSARRSSMIASGSVPTPEDVPFEVNMNLIIEFYR